VWQPYERANLWRDWSARETGETTMFAADPVPSVGLLVAITSKSAMDDPNRIAKSKAAGALFGLTPKKYQPGEKDVTGGITRAGDEMVRTELCEAANVLWRT
jgi:transposase